MKQNEEHFQDAISSVAIKQCAGICCHFLFSLCWPGGEMG